MHSLNQKSVSDVFRQSPLWVLALPGDAAAGLGSSAWTPVAAEISRHVGAGASADARRAVYAQVVAMLSRIWDEATTPQRSPHLSPADRLTFGSLVQVLLHHYRPLAAA